MIKQNKGKGKGNCIFCIPHGLQYRIWDIAKLAMIIDFKYSTQFERVGHCRELHIVFRQVPDLRLRIIAKLDLYLHSPKFCIVLLCIVLCVALVLCNVVFADHLAFHFSFLFGSKSDTLRGLIAGQVHQIGSFYICRHANT